jgi:lysyl-tRNA synthetase class 2
MAWQPTASITTLRERARILQTIRDFFAARQVLAVETPLLSHTSVTDPYIQSIATAVQNAHGASTHYYLQTSPEYAMKRLLASGSGDIYQITKAFRQDEVGAHHNPEFTMLEWYRLGFDHYALMDEMDELLQLILKTPPAIRLSYADLFEKYCGINPHEASVAVLRERAHHVQINFDQDSDDRDLWLNLLMSHHIEPQLNQAAPTFVYDFPASQAALARIAPGSPPTAARFEVYFKGIELANGFHELQDPAQQRARFEANLATRTVQQLPLLPIDEYFLAALQAGLPDCAGVALGLDRVIMLALQQQRISHVLSFDWMNA